MILEVHTNQRLAGNTQRDLQWFGFPYPVMDVAIPLHRV